MHEPGRDREQVADLESKQSWLPGDQLDGALAPIPLWRGNPG
jgi:hypothetical protein